MTSPDVVSTCHGSPVTVAGDTTQHWACRSCGQPCDAVHPEHLKQFAGNPPPAAGGADL